MSRDFKIRSIVFEHFGLVWFVIVGEFGAIRESDCVPSFFHFANKINEISNIVLEPANAKKEN